MMRDSFTVDEPKLAKSVRRRMSRYVRLRLRDATPTKQLIAWVWPFVAEAYSAGYRAGHEDQMQMRIRDEMERGSCRS